MARRGSSTAENQAGRKAPVDRRRSAQGKEVTQPRGEESSDDCKPKNAHESF